MPLRRIKFCSRLNQCRHIKLSSLFLKPARLDTHAKQIMDMLMRQERIRCCHMCIYSAQLGCAALPLEPVKLSQQCSAKSTHLFGWSHRQTLQVGVHWLAGKEAHLKHCCIEVYTPSPWDSIMLMKDSEKHVHEQGLAAAHTAMNIQACGRTTLVKTSTSSESGPAMVEC